MKLCCPFHKWVTPLHLKTSPPSYRIRGKQTFFFKNKNLFRGFYNGCGKKKLLSRGKFIFLCVSCVCVFGVRRRRPPRSLGSGPGNFARPSAVAGTLWFVLFCLSLSTFLLLLLHVVAGWIPKLTMRKKTFSSLPVEWSGWWVKNVCEQALTHTRLDPSFFFSLLRFEFEFVDERRQT